MDIDLFRDGEQFSTFDSHNFLDPYPDDSTSLDGIHNFARSELYEWDIAHERELNDELSLKSSSNNYCETMNMNKISESPSTKEDFQKIMNDWQQFINMDSGCEDYPIEDPIVTPEENDVETVAQKHSPLHELLNLPSNSSFDIAMYLNEDEPQLGQSILAKKPRAGMKKIDLKAQRYIVEEDEADVDVETVSECEISPVLEAGDLNSLLEQFEATQLPQIPPDILLTDDIEEVVIKKEPVDNFAQYNPTDNSNINCKPEVVKVKKEFIEKDVVKIKKEAEMEVNVKKEPKNEWIAKKKEKKVETQSEICRLKDERPVKMEIIEVKIEQAQPLTIKNEDAITQNAIQHVTPHAKSPAKEPSPPNNPPPTKQQPTKRETGQTPTPSKPSRNIHRPPESTTPITLDTAKNKQIRDALPPELIARIKESGKRKPISVIPPIPSKRRGGPRAQEGRGPRDAAKRVKTVSSEAVQLDHDYCSSNGSYPEHTKKDSGFESAEEDDRAIMRQQPMVKNADGKLMVSLLKVNTIRSSADANQKKKLNLEEYKKRREGFLKSQNSSQNCSPISSTCSSPLPEDEHTRRIKHQEKLMRMAMEVLNTPPKSEKKPEAAPVVTPPPQPAKTPPDMEKKTLVSIGVNTDFKICKNIDPVAPVEQLEQIKPLLKKASAKINCNSLITSLIENIPKVMNQSEASGVRQPTTTTTKSQHGEDMTIVYLPKNRAATKTMDVEVQTNISLIQQCKQSRYRRRRRRRNSSSSSSASSGSRKSGSSSRYSRERKSSCSSGSSRSSWSSRSSRSDSSYTSRSSSRSRSRSTSPRHSRRDRERLREVEERRVIYVGRISSSTTRENLRKRFQRFGPITNISLHFRDHGYLDNYGFVTFANKLDAYEAIEHGNDDPYHPKYDLSFGGRRIFCKTSYSDLDNMRDEATYFSPRVVEDSFDTLLREAQEKLRKRKV